jgi:hypothetical protein
MVGRGPDKNQKQKLVGEFNDCVRRGSPELRVLSVAMIR